MCTLVNKCIPNSHYATSASINRSRQATSSPASLSQFELTCLCGTSLASRLRRLPKHCIQISSSTYKLSCLPITAMPECLLSWLDQLNHLLWQHRAYTHSHTHTRTYIHAHQFKMTIANFVRNITFNSTQGVPRHRHSAL